MPHDYSHAIHLHPGRPGTVIFSDNGQTNQNTDTASSVAAVLHEHGEVLTSLTDDGDAPVAQAVRAFKPGTETARRPALPARTFKILKCVSRLTDCHPSSGRRELGASSRTVAAVVRAAEISLQARGLLGRKESLSVPALEEFTTLLGRYQSLSTIYHTLSMAKQIGFLRERDVDALSNRFSGEPHAWKEARVPLSGYVFLNDEKDPMRFSPVRANKWLATAGPVVLRVDPTLLRREDNPNVPLVQPKEKLNDNQHHAVVAVEPTCGGAFKVLTGWSQHPVATIGEALPSEGWGLTFGEKDHDEHHGGDHLHT